MKYFLFFLILNFTFCLKAKKSPFDLSEPSFGMIGFIFASLNRTTSSDTTPPTVTVTNLKSKGTIETGSIVGTASDNVGVSSVEVQINSGSYAAATTLTNSSTTTGTKDWTYKIPSTAKWTYAFTNTVNIRVKDTSGNTTVSAMTAVQKGENLDSNGDGFFDLIVSAPTYNANQGRVYVFNGSSNGIAQTAAGSANQIFTGTNSNLLGRYLAFSDFNLDGYGDLVICSSLLGNANNKASVYLGSTNGFVASTIITAPSGTTTEFCSSLLTADFNGDGYSDLAISDVSTGANGFVYIYNGTASGFSVTPTLQLSSASDSNFGIALTAGDINGDGYSDLICAKSTTSNLFTFFGSSSGLSTTATSLSTIAAVSSSPRMLLADLSGDGKADLILTDTSDSGNTGRILIYMSNGSTISTSSSVIITGEAANDQLGQFLTTADFNNDGINDLLVGASIAGSSQGYAYLFLSCTNIGPCKGSGVASAKNDLKIVGVSGQAYLFGTFIGFRDLNGDGFKDLFIGSDSHFASVANQGGLYIFNGSSSGITATSVTQNSKLIIGEAISSKFGRTGI
jgi:hypothetical protein